ncbi:potassium channel family protein [Acetobacterium bakii]|uniref:Ion transport channel n=1 Tax=Acetobacterium bakii TaxID=52689 RepID=A0A0L6TY99_9FIRM|nr:potassium channel family protein [Acetobacterium bakii]KNZ41052.1 ion transport channel [Acetobacterium bakii]
MGEIINEFPSYQNLANGNTIIIFYDCFILLLFIFELFLFYNKDRYAKEIKLHEKQKIKPLRRFFVKIAVAYQYQGVLTVTAILLVISLLVVSSHHRILLSELITIFGSFIVFLIIVFLVQRLFMRLDQFQDDIVSRYVDLIYYIILGHWFVLYADFISPPSLPLGLVGLAFALFLCFSVMIRAIANPSSIRSSVSKRRKYQETASILKGMIVLVFSELGILYLMVYNCFKISPDFYLTSASRTLDAFDMFYYLIISFATIGYGDIHPVRLDGMIYSELVAMIIGLASMFSTAIFVGAVVGGAAQMSRNQNEEGSEDKDTEELEMFPVIREKLKNRDI